MDSKQSRIPKPLLPILTVGTTAGTIYEIISKAFGFIELLNEQGTDAFHSLIKPAILAVFAFILSVAYISSSRSAKKKAAKAALEAEQASAAAAAELAKNGEGAVEGAAGGEGTADGALAISGDGTIAGDGSAAGATDSKAARMATAKAKAASTASSVASFFGRLIDFIVRACILVFVVAVIAFGIYGALVYKEYTQRPVVNVLDYVDLSEAIAGYDGEGTYNSEAVKYELPYYIKEVYRSSKNFDNKKDYSDEQSEWARFYDNLDYEVKINESGLSNDDVATISAEYRGNDLSELKAGVHVIIEGVGSSKTIKVGDIKELPYRFADVAKAKSEKADVIKAVADRLMNDILADGNAEDYKYSCAFCRSKYDAKHQPDALVVVATYVKDKGASYEQQKYKACYLYPFDSRVEADIAGSSGSYDRKSDIQFIIDYPYDDIEQLEREIVRGEKFDSNAEYALQVIE